MEIIEFKNEQFIIDYLGNCSWGSAKFLYNLIIENKVEEVLGDKTKIIVLADNQKVISFATYAKRDCILDDNLYPWIGFVYTDKEYRGNRFSQQVINYIINKATEDGFFNIYLATDHTDFYEKYGFKYVEDRIDIYNELSRIYKIDLK